ncbi:hypothetical protein JHC42_14795 [Pseudomonas sp. OA3]|jgi:hypothetical protein|nr:hypothetical protein [Pseudomonas sp. OA3]
MGMEDREWYRDELRSKGKKPSWDNFNASMAQSPAPTPTEGQVPRIAKVATPPSDIHLQAQQILDARADASKGSPWPMLLMSFFVVNAMGYAGYLFLR